MSGGPERIAAALVARLTSDLPPRLAALEADLDLPEGSLPPPQTILPRDEWHIGVEHFPAILVVAQELIELRPVDRADDATVRYRARYAFRVFCWARGDDDASTDLARKRLTQVTRESLLTVPSAGADGLAVEPSTLRESYSDIAVDETSHATIAAAWIAFEVMADEFLAAPTPDGTAESVTVTTLIHPALA